jgi:hypothetical protein
MTPRKKRTFTVEQKVFTNISRASFRKIMHPSRNYSGANLIESSYSLTLKTRTSQRLTLRFSLLSPSSNTTLISKKHSSNPVNVKL